MAKKSTTHCFKSNQKTLTIKKRLRRSIRIQKNMLKDKSPKLNIYGQEFIIDPRNYDKRKRICVKYTENVSTRTFSRLLFSAVKEGNLDEVRRLTNNKRMPGKSLKSLCSHVDDRSAMVEAFCSEDHELILCVLESWFKNKDREADDKSIEPRLNIWKSNGRRARFSLDPTESEIAFNKFTPFEGFREPLLKQLIKRNVSFEVIENFRVESHYLASRFSLQRSVRSSNSRYFTDLLYSSKEFHNHIVRALRFGYKDLALSLASHPDSSDTLTPLQMAILKSDKRLILKMKKDLDEESNTAEKVRACHIACVTGDFFVLNWLYTIHPHIFQLKDEDGWHCIHYAASSETDIALQFLILIGVSICEKNKKSETPLHIAVRAGRRHNVKLLLTNIKAMDKLSENKGNRVSNEKSMVNALTNKCRTPLHYACYHKRTDIVDDFAHYSKTYLNCQDSSDEFQTPLMVAASMGDVEGCKLLLSKKCDIHVVDRMERTPLMYAAINGRDEVIRLLLRNNFDPTVVDKFLNTALQYACAYGWLSAVIALVEDYSFVLGFKKSDVTPIQAAYNNGHYGIITWLMNSEHSHFVEDSIASKVSRWIQKQKKIDSMNH